MRLWAEGQTTAVAFIACLQSVFFASDRAESILSYSTLFEGKHLEIVRNMFFIDM